MKRVAILCSGLDEIMRGYETHCRTLFDSVSKDNNSDFDFFLFKRNGSKGLNTKILRTPFRKGRICKSLSKLRGDTLYWEYLFFALRFIFHSVITRNKFDTISLIEPMAAKTIYKFRKLLPGSPKVVFTHGVWMEPFEYINNADVFHEVSNENYVEMKAYLEKTNSNKKVILLPHFLNKDTNGDYIKEELRDKYNVRTSKVMLSVGAINRGHKRMHYVIEEASKLSQDWTLILCGGVRGEEAEDLIRMAEKKLGERFKHVFVPREQINEVYALADLFVLSSTQEGFGIVNIEAMRAGVPVLLHDNELFNWILKQEDCCIDMTEENKLSSFVSSIENNENWFKEKSELNKTLYLENYSWTKLNESYYKMFA